MLVQHILKSKGAEGVVTVKPGTRVSAAAEVLSQRRIGTVVISSDGKSPVGILSERDIVREIGKRGAACMADLVEDMMTRDPRVDDRGPVPSHAGGRGRRDGRADHAG